MFDFYKSKCYLKRVILLVPVKGLYAVFLLIVYKKIKEEIL